MNAFLDKWVKLANVKRELVMKNWFLGTNGNISIKISEDPLLFLVSVNEAEKNFSADEEFIVVNDRGEKVFEESEAPSSEVLIHSLLYQHTGAQCILQVHTVDNNVISEIYGDIGEIVFQNKENLSLYDALNTKSEGALRLPIIKRSKEALTQLELYKEYAYCDVGAVLVKNHGITVWGRTIEEAKKCLEAMEFLISSHIKLLMMQNQQKSFT